MLAASDRITVVTPSIPARHAFLARAITSVAKQEHPAYAIEVALDVDYQGAGPTRTRAMRNVRTPWLAFLDDDDEFYPHHLAHMVDMVRTHDVDVVVPWFDVIGGTDPFPQHAGRPIPTAAEAAANVAAGEFAIHSFPITCLVRTSLALEVEFVQHGDEGMAGDDYPFWVDLVHLGARFHSSPVHTWAWHHDSANTSGTTTKRRLHEARGSWAEEWRTTSALPA